MSALSGLILIFLTILCSVLLRALLLKGKETTLVKIINEVLFFIFGSTIINSFLLLWLKIYRGRTLAIVLIAEILICLILLKKSNHKIFPKINFKTSKLDFIVLIVCLLFLIPTYLRMSEWLIGGMDAGNYVSIAYSFVNRHSYQYPLDFNPSQFGCLKAFECKTGEFNPLYLPAYPLLLAFGLLISSSVGQSIVQLAIAFGALLSFYNLVSKLFNKKIAFLAFGILIIMPLQILYSKEFMSEILGQVFFFSAMLFLIDSIKENSRLKSLLAFGSVALLLLTKLDAILIIIPLGLIIIIYNLQNSKSKLFRFSPMILVSVSLFYQFFALTYSSHPISRHTKISPTGILVLMLVIFSFISSFINYKKIYTGKLKKIIETNLRKAFFTILIFLTAILFYRLGLALKYSGKIPFTHDYLNIVRITYFTSIPIALTAIGGTLYLIFKERLNVLLSLLPFYFVAWFSLLYSQHSSPLYWWGRRYLLFLIPLLAISSALFIYKMLGSKLKFPTMVVTAVIILYLFICFSFPAFKYSDNGGLNKQVIEVANNLDSHALLILGNTEISSIRFGNILSPLSDDSLRFYGPRTPLTEDKVKEIMQDNKDRTVYLVNAEDIEQAIVRNAGFDITDCMKQEVRVNYYYSTSVLCKKALICSWNQALDRFDGKYKMDTCKIQDPSSN